MTRHDLFGALCSKNIKSTPVPMPGFSTDPYVFLRSPKMTKGNLMQMCCCCGGFEFLVPVSFDLYPFALKMDVVLAFMKLLYALIDEA